MKFSVILFFIIFMVSLGVSIKVTNRKKTEKKYNELNERFEIRDLSMELKDK